MKRGVDQLCYPLFSLFRVILTCGCINLTYIECKYGENLRTITVFHFDVGASTPTTLYIASPMAKTTYLPCPHVCRASTRIHAYHISYDFVLFSCKGVTPDF
jgi:hypothetical protein